MSPFAPTLTVALLTYNRRHYLQEALEAILRQSYGNFELLVLDNGSTDDTAEYILGLKDPRIRYIRNAPNNCTVNFNCISAYHIAIGRRVIATHDDDVMEDDMLERQMRFLDEHPGTRLVWTRVRDIDQDGQPMPQVAADGADRFFGPGEYISSFLKERLWPMPSGVMLDKAAIPQGYTIENYLTAKPLTDNPLDAAGIADVLLPARVNRTHAIGYIDRPLLRRRVHLNQFSHKASLSRPGVYLYRGLERAAQGVEGLQCHALHFEAFVERFDIQEVITTNAPETVPPHTLRRIEKIASCLEDNIKNAPDAFLAGLPIFMLRHLLVPRTQPDSLQTLDTGGHDIATQKLLPWAQRIANNPASSILEPLEGKRILVFGSAFIAALLVLEARRHGFQIMACIDSNSTRHGTKLLGVPIQAPGWMSAHATADDVIIISSERDHEHYIEAVIRQSLPGPAMLVSWKRLVDLATTRDLAESL
ncbi:MAG: glycosyltransferase [Comamonadaceae bacterium]|nr:glycosyltransferase [Comamonadaceae bacterium]